MNEHYARDYYRKKREEWREKNGVGYRDPAKERAYYRRKREDRIRDRMQKKAEKALKKALRSHKTDIPAPLYSDMVEQVAEEFKIKRTKK